MKRGYYSNLENNVLCDFMQYYKILQDPVVLESMSLLNMLQQHILA